MYDNKSIAKWSYLLSIQILASSETEQQQLLQQSTWTQSTIVFELGALADNWRSTTEWTNATALRTIKVVALIMTKPFSQNAAIPLLFPMIKKTHRQPSVGGFNLEFWTYHKMSNELIFWN